MNKYKTIFIIVLSLFSIIVIIISFQALYDKSKRDSQISEEPEIIDYSKEITDVLTKFDSLYQENILESESVGNAYVITYKGQVAMIKCFGVQKTGNPQTIDSNTLFRLASVSKTITGVLAAKLNYEKILDLDEKVIDYIPALQLQTEENTKQLSIRHLLSHTTGLIPYAYDGMVEDRVPLEKIMERLNEVEISAPPGFLYSYQNVMFSLYDIIVSEKTQKSFESVLHEKIFEPFGMTDASADFKSFRSSTNKAFPHVKTVSGYKSTRLNNRYYVTVPAAGINASISDMGQFLLAITQKEDTLFTKEERAIVFAPQVNSILKRSYYRNWDKIKSKQYAIGWRIIDYKDHTIAQHGGYISGYQSEIAICEEEEIGIAILTNSPNSNFSENIPNFFNLFFEHKRKLQIELEEQEIITNSSSVE